jgi:two-component sensor histidine kinase/ABC-type amino acid transport substrate-binding protein
MRLRLVLFLVFACGASVWPWANELTLVKVGIYQNPPKVSISQQGIPSGFIISILQEIARRERWELHYVFGTWSELLVQLESGTIDIVPDMSYTPARAQRFALSNISIIESWLQVFTNGRSIETMNDLHGLRVGVLRDSIQHLFFSSPNNLNASITLLEYANYSDTTTALLDGQIDAMVADRFFSFSSLPTPGITPTSIVFNPASIHYATNYNSPQFLLQGIDRQLASLRNDPESPYYRYLQDLLNRPSTVHWSLHVLWALGGIALTLVPLGIIALLLHQIVKIKTNQLRQLLAEKENLINELFHRTKNNMQVISALINLRGQKSEDPSHRQQLSDIVDRIEAMVMVHDRLYQQQDLSHIDLGEYLQGLCLHLIDNPQLQERITFEFYLVSKKVLFDVAIPCGLVVTELLINSFRHAFSAPQSHGIITLHMQALANNELRIQYRDNGPGCSLADLNNNGHNVGLPLVRNIVENQLEGRIAFENGRGFYCEFSFLCSTYQPRI